MLASYISAVLCSLIASFIDVLSLMVQCRLCSFDEALQYHFDWLLSACAYSSDNMELCSNKGYTLNKGHFNLRHSTRVARTPSTALSGGGHVQVYPIGFALGQVQICECQLRSKHML